MDIQKDFAGRLPKQMPIGMAYVPMQILPESIYYDDIALQRGTIYPELDLPFKGYENNDTPPLTPLIDVMQNDFVCLDLGLYLDTHPQDTDALMYFNHRVKLSREAHEKYNKKCGPLVKSDMNPQKNDWISCQWPWEYCERGDC